ncbi:MAG: hypothetical protein KF774_03415 [Planctomyces sp.]|nr:hypothetical protein [Planctomyces sp.]
MHRQPHILEPAPAPARRGVRTLLPLAALIVAAGAHAALAPEAVSAEPVEAVSVGLPERIEQIVLPGPELVPIPLTDATPVVIRIDRVDPHGTALRYDLVYYGVEPGEYDLAKYLQRKDGAPAEGLPEIPVRISSLLPAGQIEPTALQFRRLPWLGGYRALMVVVGVLWLAGLVWLLKPRRRAVVTNVEDVEEEPVSLAERLRPLVTDAMTGRLPKEKLAELERALVVCWRRRLGLQDATPAEAIAKLRQHPDASPLMTQLEVWLHRPPTADAVDVNELLKPYQNIAAHELGPALQETRR